MEFGVLTRFFRFMPVEAHARLSDELKSRNHKLMVMRPMEVRLKNGLTGPMVNFLNQPWRRMDLVLPLLRWNDEYGWVVVEALQKTGQPVLKTPRLPQGDRAAMHALYAKHGINLPPSFLITRAQAWQSQQQLPWPLQLQARLGQTGRLMRTVQDWNELDECLQEYEQIIEDPLYLRSVANVQDGAVVSMLVIGDKVAANLERPDGLKDTKPGRPSVSALYRDKIRPGKLSAADEMLAITTRRLYGVTHAVIDIKQTVTGPLLLDVNTAPNLAWFERMSGLNLVGRVVEFWEQVARASKGQ